MVRQALKPLALKPLALIVAALALPALALPAAAQAAPEKAVDTKAVQAAAHDAYIAAINSNDLATFSAALTDDVVFQYPGAPQMSGKKAVLSWATGYFQLYKTQWEKTPIGFTVAGDWAFEHYTYRSMDTDKSSGKATIDAGKGVSVFHHDKDGKWRLAIDGWSSDDASK